MQMHKLSFCEMDVRAQPVLRPSGRARSTAVLFHGGTGGITGIVFTPVCKSSQRLHQLCSWFLLSSLGVGEGGGAVLRISPSLVPSASLFWRGGYSALRAFLSLKYL